MVYKSLDKRITKTVLDVVSKLAADYPRRRRLAECVARRHLTDAQLDNLKQVNAKIDTALEHVEEGIRDYLLSDIASGNGYERSMASCFISRTSYYAKKNAVILEIARAFYLVI